MCVHRVCTWPCDGGRYCARSYLEIYNEEIRDLLQKDFKKKLELKESADQGVYVKDLSMFVLKSTSEIEHVFTVGSKNRSVGSTQVGGCPVQPVAAATTRGRIPHA